MFARYKKVILIAIFQKYYILYLYDIIWVPLSNEVTNIAYSKYFLSAPVVKNVLGEV